MPQALLEAPDGTLATTPLFPTPQRLEPAIRFWTDIFTRHASNVVVFHDREDLAVVWEVMELPTNKDGAVDPREMRRRVDAKTQNLVSRLKRLESTGEPRDDEDHVLVALMGGADSPRLAGAWGRVRSQRGIADHFAQGLERAKQWLPDIAKILADEGVPVELMALPFIESTFNPLARSSAGAAGLWQLMPATARQLGLKVTKEKDERMDVLKATRAAARMLKDNHRMLKTWPLAITGYNHGPYGLRRAVQSVGSHDLVDLIDSYQKRTWGFASKNFYAEFLAALQVVKRMGAVELALTEQAPSADESVAVD